MFSEAYTAHRAGRLDDAERGYRAVVAADPTHAQAWHMLGVVQHQRGLHDEAADLLRRAAELAPADAGLQLNLGNALKALGRIDEAIAHFEGALRIRSDFGAAHYNLGNAYASTGRHEEAVASFLRAAAVDDSAPTYNNLGTSLQALGRHAQARDAFLEALRRRPDYAGAHNNLGMTLNVLGESAAALDAFNAALRIEPNFTLAHFNLGNTLDGLERCADALPSFTAAVRLQPHFAAARFGLGNVLAALGRHREAIGHFEQAVGLEPAFALAWMNLGAAHYALGAYDAALRALGQALRLRPELAAAHYDRALILLLCGAFREGWEEYEWRLRLLAGSEAWSAPRWQCGEPLAGRTVLLHAEQGFGDTLQCVRFVPELARTVAPGRVVLEVQPELLRLLATYAADWGVALLGRGSPRPPFDCHCPLLSLPRALAWAEQPASSTGVAPQPAPGYLRAPDAYRQKWRERLPGEGRRRIGIVWSGRRQARGETRALPLTMLEPLLALREIDWFVLQPDCSAAERAWIAAPGRDNLHWPGAEFGDFADTAACLEQLDAVVTVDTSIAHLAGALGRPVWIMLPFVPDWRWFLDTAASPWYPSARLIRQAQPGDWPGVVARVRAELSA